MTVGVLAFQGDFADHEEVLRSMGVPSRHVRNLNDLQAVDRLIIPGGESTVMAKFLEDTGVGREVQGRVKDGSLAVYGTCAGAILLAKEVRGKSAPPTLRLIDIEVDRNAYGTQLQSFDEDIRVKGIAESLHVSFIRAPKFTKVGKGIEILAKLGDDPILVRGGRILAGAFHPEVHGNAEIHELFLQV